MNYRTFRITRIAPDMWVVADPNTNEVLWNGPTRAAGKRFVDLVSRGDGQVAEQGAL